MSEITLQRRLELEIKPFDPIVNDGRVDGPRAPVERARWKYATGQISLKDFERSCEIWLRWEGKHDPRHRRCDSGASRSATPPPGFPRSS